MNDIITQEDLFDRIKVLNETAWENKIKRPVIDAWLGNFANDDEKLHALYLLSQFMYFESSEIRTLLISLYRDLIKYPLIEQIRRNLGDTLDFDRVNEEYDKEKIYTRFLGMGNPSESGTYLLYFFRQENRLSKKMFINSYEIFNRYGTP